MRVSECIGILEDIITKHGDMICYVVYDGAIDEMDGCRYAALKVSRETYTHPPKDGIRKGVFFTQYKDETP